MNRPTGVAALHEFAATVEAQTQRVHLTGQDEALLGAGERLDAANNTAYGMYVRASTGPYNASIAVGLVCGSEQEGGEGQLGAEFATLAMYASEDDVSLALRVCKENGDIVKRAGLERYGNSTFTHALLKPLGRWTINAAKHGQTLPYGTPSFRPSAADVRPLVEFFAEPDELAFGQPAVGGLTLRYQALKR